MLVRVLRLLGEEIVFFNTIQEEDTMEDKVIGKLAPEMEQFESLMINEE
jgi:hypothetical protein